MSRPIRTALLLSGGGRTAMNLLELSRAGRLPIEIVSAIATRADCGGVARLREAHMSTSIVERSRGDDADALHDEADRILLDAGVELICLCGWLRHFRIVGERFGADWTHRVLNIHPALLPAFGGRGMHGMHVHEAVIRSGATQSGCTVHYVDPIYDHGPVILQRRVAVLPDDTAEALAARVFAEELIAYPDAIRAVADGGVGGPPITAVPMASTDRVRRSESSPSSTPE